MSLHRRAARRDASEREVIEALVEGGAKVQQLSGAGVPDLLVAYRGVIRLVEVKSGGGRLTQEQVAWHDAWAMVRPSIVRNGAQAKKLLRLWAGTASSTRITFPASDPITDQADGVREGES